MVNQFDGYEKQQQMKHAKESVTLNQQTAGSFDQLRPSKEQKQFIDLANKGHNVLVDACIGSGKTTAIQKLCASLPKSTSILYLTYNRLLKLDAQSKIKRYNVLVQNYHGFAYMALNRVGIHAGVSDLIQTFLRTKPEIGHYDVMILDEYQDIEQETAEMLTYIKEQNPDMQIIAVGDMEQKIYDKTTLDVRPFISQLLGEHVQIEFTQCFRLSHDIAARLGNIWGKTINGVNPNCDVSTMTMNEALTFLSEQDPKDVMCLGSRTGSMSSALNWLERDYPEKFNKHTVFASISNDNRGAVAPGPKTAIFTTFDSSKGMERKTCVIFDWDASYWSIRLRKPQQKYEILRNIFLVAASRGKNRIIFVDRNKGILDDDTLMTPPESQMMFMDCSIHDLFAFKYREDVEDAYKLLKIKQLPSIDNNHDIIEIRHQDGLIDLSPCIGIYQLAYYFNGYDIDREIDLLYSQKYNDGMTSYQRAWPIDKKILLLTSLLTNQWRYLNQVATPFVTKADRKALSSRMDTRLNPDVETQRLVEVDFSRHGRQLFTAAGYADAIVDDTVYNLQYTSAMQHEHFLECACYMIGLGLDKGVVWNTRDNILYQIAIPERDSFMNAVTRCATKGYVTKYED